MIARIDVSKRTTKKANIPKTAIPTKANRPPMRRQIMLPDAIGQIISAHRDKLWQVRAILRCLVKAGEQLDQERTESDVDYALEAALDILTPVAERMESGCIGLEAAELEDAEEVEHA